MWVDYASARTAEYVDLFAGAGGWDLAAGALGMRGVGIELDPAACLTRRAAKLATIKDDVRRWHPRDFPFARGLIASPPCQTFSSSGKGSGRRALVEILELVGRARSAVGWEVSGVFEDERTALVLEPLRWALEAVDDGNPFKWIAFEQVPSVLPIWEAIAEVLRAEGYSVATGILYAEQYGVPQTRRRAVLVARLYGEAELPMPTHSKFHPRNPDQLDDAPLWVSMADTFGETSRVGADWRLAGAGATARVTSQQRPRRMAEPAHTVTTKGTASWIIHPPEPGQRPRATVDELSLLQSFPPGYPWHGDKTHQYEQVGNAIPPKLAGAVITAVNPKLPRWISQAEALGWGMTKRPYLSIVVGTAAGGTDPQMLGGSGARAILDGERATEGHWVDKLHPDGPETWDRPLYASTVRCLHCMSMDREPWSKTSGRNDGARLSINEGAVLQSFPSAYPWRGTKREQYQQVGNAVPPKLAYAVLATLTHTPERIHHAA